MQYRPEIDGLRAVAVVPVILFHAGLDAFAGGFVGVDVFFVISGYLITSILITDLEEDRFSVARFYERRARRILPALFVVMLVCVPFAYLWMMPSQLETFSKSMMAVVVFLSNHFFMGQEDYFAPAAELAPLLHTWSLAVEEQFYLLFPVVLMFLWRFGRARALRGVVAVAVLSFLLAEWAWRHEPLVNFFLAPTRAWELLAGSVCAFLTVGRVQRPNGGLALAGLALIFVAILVYDETTPFPSVYALVPVLGTVLVILYAGKGTWAARALSLRGVVGIGLISYSAYLWHQPLFAFARLRSLTEPSDALMAGLSVASLGLAWATWRWVEQPFRRRDLPLLPSRRGVFVASGSVAAGLFAVGLAGDLGEGFEARMGTAYHRFIVAEEDSADREDGCYFEPDGPMPVHPVQGCKVPGQNGRVDVLMTGDSHALAISEALGHALSEEGIGHYDLGYSSCVPLEGLRRFGTEGGDRCVDFNASTYAYAEEAGIGTVVLTARFPLYLRGDRFDNGEGGVEAGEPGWVDLADRPDGQPDDEARRARVLAEFEARIRSLAARFNVVLVYPVPEAGWNVPGQAFKNAYLNGSSAALTTSLAAYEARTAEIRALFDRLVRDVPNIHGARVQDVLCSAETGRCLNADAAGIYYYDDDHLSKTGARLVAPVIVEAVKAALADVR